MALQIDITGIFLIPFTLHLYFFFLLIHRLMNNNKEALSYIPIKYMQKCFININLCCKNNKLLKQNIVF